MKVKANLVYRQGIELYLDSTKVGYFAASGFDTLALLMFVALLCKIHGVSFDYDEFDLEKLTEWVTA